ncbi:MAG: M23 family metallopeptidase [Erysipelotrichaceae bacterium]|nr:M23 family metallopeptidase [Erysipelotrichaceae bacterium]
MSVELDIIGRCPCDSGWISQGFKSSHRAIDIGWLTKYGANLPVKAWYDGTVIATGTDSAGGVYVVLKHESAKYTIITRYWHFVKGSIKVKKDKL